MPADTAALEAIVTTLEEMTARLVAVAEAVSGDPDDPTASELYEVERSLRAASRRLGALLRVLSGS